MISKLFPKNLRPKFYRYIAVSAVNVPLTQLLLWVFVSLLEIPAIYGNLAAVSIAAIPAFFLYKKWVWSKSSRSHVRTEVLPFWATAFSGLAISTVAVWLATLWWDSFLTIALGNITGFGIVWIGRFIFLEVVLFNNGSKTPTSSRIS